jgi:hypothetical protein
MEGEEVTPSQLEVRCRVRFPTPVAPGNSAAPTVATGPQSVKRGGNRTKPESDGTTPGASDYGQRTRTHATTHRQTHQALNADRWACPKRDRAAVWQVSVPSAPHRGSGGECGPPVAPNGLQERDNRRAALRGGRYTEQVPTAWARPEGLPEKLTPPGKPVDTLTQAQRMGW